jgi:rare lipoprotein A
MRRIALSRTTLRAGLAAPVGIVCLLSALVAAGGCASGNRRGATIERGVASWYGPGFHGRPTASGERYDMDAMTAAHRTLPFGTVVEVRNVGNGRVARVKINDRGPFKGNRILDLSRAAAIELGVYGPGTALVEIVAVGLEPIGGFTFTVQLGAFQDARLADSLARRARERHPEVEVRADDVWHRVQIGAWSRRDEAQRRADLLEAEGFDAVVVPLASI